MSNHFGNQKFIPNYPDFWIIYLKFDDFYKGKSQKKKFKNYSTNLSISIYFLLKTKGEELLKIKWTLFNNFSFNCSN